MRKNLLFAIVCVLGMLGTLNAQKTITLGEGENYSHDLPFDDYYGYSVSQQIYTSDEFSKIDGVATIESVAFKSATELTNKTYVVVYMLNTTKKKFSATTEYVDLYDKDKVFEGYLETTGLDQWSTLNLTTPFMYTGNNVLLCVASYFEDLSAWDNRDAFYTYSSSDTTSCAIRADHRIDPTNVSDELRESGQVGVDKNQVQFVYSQAKSDINVNFKSIDLGNIAMGEYWNEKESASVHVSTASYYSKIESVTCSDSFFVLSEIDYSKSPVQFVVSYDKNSTAGEKTADLTITDDAGGKVVVPMTATVYNPVSPDVFELAKEITFTDGAYTDTPDFSTLYDDYLLPNESLISNAPDAVYSLNIEKEGLVLVDVDGPQAKIALYTEDFGAKEGPAADNAFVGEETIISTTFSYDFENASLEDFSILDYDDYKDYTWKVENGSLISKSYDSWGEWGTDEWGYMNQANERILTKPYTITPNSVLTLDVNRAGSSANINLYIEVTKDGETFTELEWFDIAPNYIDDYPEMYPPYQADRRVDLGAKFASLGLEYGDYQIVLYHVATGCGTIMVDNLSLTERSSVVVPGKYYLVVAAEDTFTVNVTLAQLSTAPVAPVVKANATGETTIVLTWDAVEGATSYNVYQGTEVLAQALTTTTYTVEGLKAETQYCFTVTAVNEVGESEKSEEACATTKGESVEELNASFNIHPNPVNDRLYIETEVEVKEVAIYTITGVMVGQQTTDNRQQTLFIDVTNLNSGVYFVKVVTDNGEVVKRFVKK